MPDYAIWHYPRGGDPDKRVYYVQVYFVAKRFAGDV